MRRRGLRALVLCALLGRVVLPLFHVHEEGGHDHCHRHDAERLTVEAAEPECAICELLALKLPGLEPEPPRHVEIARPVLGELAREAVPAARPAFLWIACGPRGPPASSPA